MAATFIMSWEWRLKTSMTVIIFPQNNEKDYKMMSLQKIVPTHQECSNSQNCIQLCQQWHELLCLLPAHLGFAPLYLLLLQGTGQHLGKEMDIKEFQKRGEKLYHTSAVPWPLQKQPKVLLSALMHIGGVLNWSKSEGTWCSSLSCQLKNIDWACKSLWEREN